MTKPYLLDLRNKDFPYTKGWIDRSEGVLLANFKLLKEFVDKEKPFRFHYRKHGRNLSRRKGQDAGEYEALKRSRHDGREIWRLYVWWTLVRKREHDALNKLLMKIYRGSKKSKTQLSPLMGGHPKWKEYLRTEKRLSQKDQEMLHRLVEIRQRLWT